MAYAIDFETFYDDRNGYGIKEQGVWGYIHDKRFDPYMVTVTDGTTVWEGRPEDILWEEILRDNDVREHFAPVFVAHNAFFDRQVFARCQGLGLIPKNIRPVWHCTANLSAYLGAGRSLADACKTMLDIEVDKSMRSYMNGRQWNDVKDTDAGPKLREYARKDAELCWLLWDKFSDRWPEMERIASEITMQQCMTGVKIDRAALEKGMDSVLKAHLAAVNEIPWSGDIDKKGKEITPLSTLAFKSYCKEFGLPVPESIADGDEHAEEWIKQYGEKHPVIRHMQTVRSTKVLLEKARTLHTRLTPDDTFSFELKYWGGHTGRWSGGYEEEERGVTGTGFNIQNLPREEMYGLNLRHVIIPRDGFKFISADYSQIEPRVLSWLVNDQPLLNLMRKGMSPYEAHARVAMGYNDPRKLKDVDKPLYQLAKARILALGYGAGWKKFLLMSRLYVDADVRDVIFGAPVEPEQVQEFERYLEFLKHRFPEWLVQWRTLPEAIRTQWVNSWLIVNEYRKQNPLITDKEHGFWHVLESNCRHAVGKTFSMELPSGRAMRYLHVRTHGGLSVVFPHSGLRRSIWGGFLTENITQAVARDILCQALVNCHKAGIRTAFSAHDEIVAEVPWDFPKQDLVDIMIKCPDWIPGLPIDVEAKDLEHYEK